MTIRRAEEKDIDGITDLLHQVLEVHAALRPDLFISGTTKYTRDELLRMFKDDSRPIYVALDENGAVAGYAFCAIQEQPFSTTMKPRTSLYIDDLCVDSKARGRHVGKAIYEHVKSEAARLGCKDLTLNVWEGNDAARKFYEKMGFKIRKTMMDYDLSGDAQIEAQTAAAAFRTMRRFRQQLPREDCVSLLKSERRGVLSLIGDGGWPYGLPLNHWYCEEDGALYFHGAKEGHKIDAIKACNKASYCVYDKGFRKEGEWALNVKSVIVFGKIEFVDDGQKAAEICRRLALKFTDDEAYIERELANGLSRVLCWKLVPEHITGKLVNES